MAVGSKRWSQPSTISFAARSADGVVLSAIEIFTITSSEGFRTPRSMPEI